MSRTESLGKEPAGCLLRLPSLRLFTQRDVAARRAAGWRGWGATPVSHSVSEQGCGATGGLEAFFAVMPRLQLCFLNLNLLHRELLCLKAYPLSTCLPSWQSLHIKQNSSHSEALITHLPRKHVEKRKLLLCLFV